MKAMRVVSFSLAFSLIADVVAVLGLTTESVQQLNTVVSQEEIARFTSEPKLAVVVGVGAYPQGSALSALNYARQDAELLSGKLTDLGYTVNTIVDVRATRGIVRNALADLRKANNPGEGTVLFFFSGHGFAQGGANYLAPYEATATDLASSGLPLDEVRVALESTRARVRLLFIDACRNVSQGTKDIGGQKGFDAFADSEGTAMLLSTRFGDVSWESSKLQQGVFTHFLVRALDEGSRSEDGYITFRGLANAVTKTVREYGVVSPEVQVQVPYVRGEWTGNIVVAKTPLVVVNPYQALTDHHPPESAGANEFARGEQFYKIGMYAEARAELQRSTKLGHPGAMVLLGFIYYRGLGIPPDYELSLRWFGRAAQEGNDIAMYNLGRMNEEGIGTPKNLNEARRWYQEAADRGNETARTRLRALR